jgi:hypothetical protein
MPLRDPLLIYDAERLQPFDFHHQTLSGWMHRRKNAFEGLAGYVSSIVIFISAISYEKLLYSFEKAISFIFAQF